jgi:thiamine-phosphate pyrophosphorylase
MTDGMAGKNSSRCVWGIYVILDKAIGGGRSHLELAREALLGGARVIQLRDKTSPFEELVEVGHALRALIHEHEATFIGQSDFPAAIAREIVGTECIIGLSTHTKIQALEATRQPVDYIGVGPIYPTTSKQSEWNPLGIPHIRWVRENISLPMVAIGGITTETLADCAAAGADNVAMIAEIMGAEDITGRMQNLAAQFKQVS